MKDVVLDEVKRLSKKYGKSEKLIELLIKICKDTGHAYNEAESIIEKQLQFKKKTVIV